MRQSNISLNAASSKEYNEMMDVLRPEYVEPNWKQIAAPLLQNASDEVYHEINMELQNNFGTNTLLQDGW